MSTTNIALPYAAAADDEFAQLISHEQAVLGSMLASEQAILDVSEILTDQMFYRPAHGEIYRCLLAMHANGEPIDPELLGVALEKRGQLNKIPDRLLYLHTLQAVHAAPLSATYYADIIAEKAERRRWLQAAQQIHQLAQAGASLDIADLRDRAQAAVDTVTTAHTTGAGYTNLADLRGEHLARLKDIQDGLVPPGLPTGLRDLDQVLGGLKAGQMIIVAGRPGMGKSTLALDMVRNTVIRESKNVLVCSLEMTESEVLDRVVSAEGRVRLTEMNTKGKLQPQDYQHIDDAYDRLVSGGLLAVDGTPNQTISQMRAAARRIKAQQGLDLIVIDYLQLMSSGGRYESRQQEISEYSRQIKIMAQQLEVPVVALSQLNRASDQRQDKRPALSDLRESGSLEQDADVVLLVHRPEVYDKDDRPGEADLMIVKHRAGPMATVGVASQLHYSRFVDMA
ncbi:replicative DNA helicase [Pseudonocardiaceae bacterium YIM PH 21723]|nr:replicative DNA helicase [Pseudonocardiaceae bacterium YIM PH 21723]